MMPESILESWEIEATYNSNWQYWRHRQREHRFEFDACWLCQRNRAVCRSKRRHETLESAQAQCDEMNHPSRPKLVLPYRCPWSEGLHWHAATAIGTARIRRVRKRMSRILR